MLPLHYSCSCFLKISSLVLPFLSPYIVFSIVPVAAKITLSLIGKMGIAAAFHLLYLYTAELFTTRQRSLALGHNNFWARIGSTISPYVNDLLVRR